MMEFKSARRADLLPDGNIDKENDVLPNAQVQFRMDAKLKRLFWLWHFWIGIIAGPVLMTLAATGGIYVFQPELECWWYSDVLAVDSDLLDDTKPQFKVQPIVELATQSLGSGFRPYGLEIETGSGRAPAVLAISTDRKHTIRRVHFDPVDGNLKGEIPKPNTLSIVLDIHRRLMMGTTGRVLTELTTGWTIGIVVAGIVIWWPRTWRKTHGVWSYRFNAKRYVVLRDLHSVTGVYFSILFVLIAMSGLLFTLVWGGLFQMTALSTGQFDLHFDPPSSSGTKEDVSISADRILEIVRELKVPLDRLSVQFSASAKDPITVTSGHWIGPSATRFVHIDRVTGEVLSDFRLSELPPMAIYSQWNYPLHVGSVGGIATKLVWLFACACLTALPVLGYLMWLTRRKAGTLGFPRTPEARQPKWLTFAIVAYGIALPVVGLSLIIVFILDIIVRRIWRTDDSTRPKNRLNS